MDFARAQIVRKIDELHGRAHPAHVALVGPRGMGKTRIAVRVVARHAAGSAVFAGATLVDLRSAPPASGEELIARVADGLRGSLERERTGKLRGLAEYLAEDDPETRYDLLKLVVDAIRETGRRWLVVLDGCDEPLKSPEIPRNAWDNLRVFGETGAVTWLTTSRAPLSELCSKEVRLSPFFNLFHATPVWVEPLDDEDWRHLGEAAGEGLDDSAIDALRRWTGGHPYLLQTLLDELRPPGMTADQVDADAWRLVDGRCEAMRFLWQDCSLETQQDLTRLAHGPVSTAGWSRDRVRALTGRGLARLERGTLHGSSELMRQVALELQPGVEDLGRLFGTSEGFEQNIQGVLELRLARVQGADEDLLETARFCVQHVARPPKACLGRARDLRDRALQLVWTLEAPGGVIPDSWIAHWKFGGLDREILDDYVRDQRIPEDGGRQCGLLRLAMGRQGLKPVARYTSRTTHALIEHMNGLGNVRNHSTDPVTVTLAAAFCLAAIELCESLARDLAGAASRSGPV